jgi:hypothetical protein
MVEMLTLCHKPLKTIPEKSGFFIDIKAKNQLKTPVCIMKYPNAKTALLSTFWVFPMQRRGEH